MGADVRPIRLLGPVLIVAGVVALAFGFLQGQAGLSLFLIFPVVTATGGWSALGILLFIAGFFALFLTLPSYVAEAPAPSEPSAAPPPGASPPVPPTRRWGGVVFLGPIPVVFGSDAKVARWMLVVGILLFVGLVVLTVISIWGI